MASAPAQELAKSLSDDYPKHLRTVRRALDALEAAGFPLLTERANCQTRCDHRGREVRLFAVDRIRSLTVTDHPYQMPLRWETKVSEELEVLKSVAQRLDTAGIPYMVTGSMALNYYAVPRMTRDIDLVVELFPGDTQRLCDIFQDDFYIDQEAVRQAVEEKGMFNIIHYALVIKVDFVVRKHSEYRYGEFSRRRRVSVEGHDLFMVAPEDLIISKLDWSRETRSEVQLADVRNLLACVQGLDRDYLARWISHLGLDSLYREVSR